MISIMLYCGHNVVANFRDCQHMEGQDYNKRFDPLCYIRDYMPDYTVAYNESLKMLHDVFSSYQEGAGLKVLDYGCGPTVFHQAGAVPYADQIVFADYTAQNRQVVQLWLDRDPRAPDWNMFFEYAVVQLERKEKEEVVKRQEALRRIGKVAACNLLDDQTIEPQYKGPYDVIFISQCLCCVCFTPQEYETAIAKISQLLKPGGKLAITDTELLEDCVDPYYVGKEKFSYYAVTPQVLKSIVEKLGFRDIQQTSMPCQYIPKEGEEDTKFLGFQFLTAIYGKM